MNPDRQNPDRQSDTNSNSSEQENASNSMSQDSKPYADLEKKINLFLRQICEEFLKDFNTARDKWIRRERRYGREPKPREFYQWIQENTGTDFPQTAGIWEKKLEKNSRSGRHDDSLKGFSFKIEKLWRVNYFLRSQNLSDYDMYTFFKEAVLETHGFEDIIGRLAAIPPAYLPSVKEEIKSQVDLQIFRTYEQFWRRLEDFRGLLDETIRGNSQEKHRALNNLISIIFTWYTSTFSQDRAVILLKAKYWNGAHRRIQFNRSRTTEEFISSSPDFNHQNDILWLLKELEIDVEKTASGRTLPKNKALRRFFEQEEFKSVDAASLKEKAEELFNLSNHWLDTKEAIAEYAMSNEYPEHRIIQQVLEDCCIHSNWAKDEDWNDENQRSLSYYVMKNGEDSAEDKFAQEKFLAASLDEVTGRGKTDQSGYAIPLYSYDRKSVIGALMVVSGNINAFTKDKLRISKEGVSNELSIIREMARLTELCIHEISRSSLPVYNFTRFIDPGKTFPEVVFDIWTANLTFSRQEENNNDDLNRALAIYQEQRAIYSATCDNFTGIQSIFEIALEKYRRSIEMRFGAAVILCIEEIRKDIGTKQQPTLRDLFRVRVRLESECLSLAQKSILKNQPDHPVDVRYLGRVLDQAKGLQQIIEVLEDILIHRDLQDLELIRASINQGLLSSLLLRENPSLRAFYSDFIETIVTQFIEQNASESSTINLKRLIYRLHVHFHITISMLSAMELMPYAVLFLVLASSSSIGATTVFNATIDYRDEESIRTSSQEHRELLDRIDATFKGSSQPLTELVADHIRKVEERIQKQDPTILERTLPSYIMNSF
jgi:hypothetical protein